MKTGIEKKGKTKQKKTCLKNIKGWKKKLKKKIKKRKLNLKIIKFKFKFEEILKMRICMKKNFFLKKFWKLGFVWKKIFFWRNFENEFVWKKFWSTVMSSTAFWAITREPEIFLTCGFRRMLDNHPLLLQTRNQKNR